MEINDMYIVPAHVALVDGIQLDDRHDNVRFGILLSCGKVIAAEFDTVSEASECRNELIELIGGGE